MPWISNSIRQPWKKGWYKCLIEIDGFGTLSESQNEKFTGTDWDLFDSSCQFIRYWWATKEEHKVYSDTIDSEMENYENTIKKI